MSGNFLKQSTASQSRAIGPFVDDTDFKTAETGLTIANTDIKLMVNGAASANKNSGGGTHRVNGFYGITFDATDTATVGELEVSVVVAGALPVFKTFYVLEEAVYDMLFGASALGYIANAPVNVAQLSGDGGAADNAEAFFDGTGYAGTNNVIPTVTTLTNLPTIPANWLTAAGIASDAGAELADAVLDEVVEGSTTMRQLLRGFAAVMLGKASGLATTTAVYRDIGDTKDRISATVDADGNRSAVTRDLT